MQIKDGKLVIGDAPENQERIDSGNKAYLKQLTRANKFLDQAESQFQANLGRASKEYSGRARKILADLKRIIGKAEILEMDIKDDVHF